MVKWGGLQQVNVARFKGCSSIKSNKFCEVGPKLAPPLRFFWGSADLSFG